MKNYQTCSMLGRIALLAILIPYGTVAFSYNIYVSNEKDNTVSVIDSDKLEVTNTVKVGQRPRGLAISKDQKYLYICASNDDRIDVMDLNTHQLVDILPSGPDPELMVLSPDGNLLYIANEDDNIVTVLNIQSKKIIKEIPVGVEPEGMGISPDGKTLVNTSETTNMAHFIDTATYKNTDNILVGERPRFAEFSADGQQIWVSAEIGGTIHVIDNAKRKPIKEISFAIPGIKTEAIQPVGVRLTSDGKWAFVALGPASRVAVVDAKTFEVEKYLLVGQRVWQLDFDADEKRLYTTNGVSNDVSVISVDDLRVIKSVAVGRYPWGVAVREQ